MLDSWVHALRYFPPLPLSNVNNNKFYYVAVKSVCFSCSLWREREIDRERERERERETQLLSGPRRRRRRGGRGEGGRPGGGVGGTCRVACRFHWERGKHQVNIYELSPPEDFRHPSVSLSVLDLPLLFIYLGYLFFFFQADIWSETSQTADLCQPYVGVNDICEVEEEECIVSLWN